MTTTTLTGTHAPARRARHTAPPTRHDPRRPGRAPAAARQAPHPQPHRWFADRLLDVLSGRRPVTWMLGHTTGETTYDQLWELAAQGVLRPPKGRPTPLVRRCGYGVPTPGVLESYALIASGDALRALAFRLEYGADRRWRCAAVETSGPSW